jgi:photosystem II stability/assembly factor-like uncharacterized protein
MKRITRSVQIYVPRICDHTISIAVIALAVLSILPVFGQTGWFPLYPPISPDFRGVCFPADCETGYVVGHYGAILKTSDTGQTWNLQASGTGFTLTSVDFPVDAQTGFAVGWYGTILKTSDGETWDTVSSGTSENLYAIQFPTDTDTGYAVGEAGTILKTIDGGEKWTAVHTGTTEWFTSLHFPNDCQVGYVAGSHGNVLKTTDGGEHWIDQTFNTDLWFESVCFPEGPEIGYASGYNCVLYKTADGGETWVDMNPTADPYACWHVVFFIDDQVGFIAGTGDDIRKTYDGMTTWVSQSVPMGIIFDLEFPVNGDTGFAVGATGILKTTDGGGTFVEERAQDHIETLLFAVPNPFVSHTCIPGKENESCIVRDVTGRSVGTYQGHTIGADLEPGIYFVCPQQGSHTWTGIVKIK